MAIRVAGKEFRRQVFGPAAPTGDNQIFAPADNFLTLGDIPKFQI
jgi:hypothetical protein